MLSRARQSSVNEPPCARNAVIICCSTASGASAEGQASGALGLLFGIGTERECPDRQNSGRFAGEGAVEQRERLGGDRRHRPARAARVGVGAVERLEERIPQVAPDEDVEAAPVPVPSRGETGQTAPLLLSLVSSAGSSGKTDGPPMAGLSEPETRKQRVADRLAVEPLPILAAEEQGSRDPQPWPSRSVTDDWPIRRAGDDQPVHRLQAPASADQLGGQPVQQLGVRRLFAHRAEVAGRGDESAAEMMLPEPVDDHPRGQRVFGADQPVRQGASAAARPRGGMAASRGGPPRRAEDGRKRRRPARAPGGEIAAPQQVRGGAPGPVSSIPRAFGSSAGAARMTRSSCASKPLSFRARRLVQASLPGIRRDAAIAVGGHRRRA